MGLAFLAQIAHSNPGVRFEQNVEMDLLVPKLQSLYINQGVFTAGPPTIEDFHRGFLEIPSPAIATVSSNTPWTLSVRRPPAQDSDGIGLERITLLHGSETIEISRSWKTLASGAGSPEEHVSFQIRIPLDWKSTQPGSYEPKLEYRLAADGSLP